MSLRLGLLPSLLRVSRPQPAKAVKAVRAFHFLPSSGPKGPSAAARWSASRAQPAQAVARVAQWSKSGSGRGSNSARSSHRAYVYSVGLGLAGLTLFPRTNAQCQAPQQLPAGSVPRPEVVKETRPPPVESEVSVMQLSFGATCGICAGVFVKKGFKALAFALGGIFVLLQYLASKSYVTVDWGKVAKSYDSAIGTVNDKGEVIYPTVSGVYNGIVDFLTANFQQRATFIAGFILGLRIG